MCSVADSGFTLDNIYFYIHFSVIVLICNAEEVLIVFIFIGRDRGFNFGNIQDK